MGCGHQLRERLRAGFQGAENGSRLVEHADARAVVSWRVVATAIGVVLGYSVHVLILASHALRCKDEIPWIARSFS